MSKEFHFLPYIIIFILSLYVLILLLLFILFPHKNKNYFLLLNSNYLQTITTGQFNSFLSLSTFLLFLFRIIFTIFFSIYIILSLGPFYLSNFWIFYTNWNAILFVIYFFGSSILSFCSIFNLKFNKIEEMSFVYIIIYLVLAPTAFFVTFVDLFLLSSYPSYFNFAPHLVTTIAILIELTFNRIPVTIRDLSFTLSWPMLYLIYIWILRSQQVAKIWPYNFLTTSTATSFIWYGLLFFLVLVFYFIFYGLTKLKNYLIATYEPTTPEIEIAKENQPQLTHTEP